MPARNDDSFLELHLTAGADYLAGRRTGNVTALPDGSNDSDGTGVGEGKFDLILGTDRAENRAFEAGLG